MVSILQGVLLLRHFFHLIDETMIRDSSLPWPTFSMIFYQFLKKYNSCLDHCVHYYDLRNPKKSLAVLKGHRKAVSYAKFLNENEVVSA